MRFTSTHSLNLPVDDFLSMPPHESTQSVAPSIGGAEPPFWTGLQDLLPDVPQAEPTVGAGAPDTQLLQSRLSSLERLIRSGEGSWPVYAIRELLNMESAQEVLRLCQMKDNLDSKFKVGDWMNLVYVLQSYSLMSIYSLCPTHPSPRCKQPLPIPLPLVYDLDLLKDVRRLLLKLKANLRVFRDLFDSNQLGIKNLTSMAGLKTMRTLNSITEVVAFLENVYLAGFCMLFLFEGAVMTAKKSPLEIPGVPSSANEIISLVERVYGQLDSEDVAYIKTTIKTYGIHGLQLPLILAVLISPLLLLQGFKIAGRATSKLTVLQIAFCLGNQKPPLLREIETRFWGLLQQVSRDNVSLFSAVFEFFDQLPWDKIEGLLPEETSFFMLAFSLRCHHHEDLDLLTRVNDGVRDSWNETGPLFVVDPDKSIFSHISVRNPSYPENLEDARKLQDQLSVKHVIISQPGRLEGSLSHDFRTVLTTKVEPYGNTIEIHDQSVSRDRNDHRRKQYGTVEVLLDSLRKGPAGRILITYPIPSTRHEVSVPILCTATIAYNSTRSRGPRYRGSEASPDDLCHRSSMFSGALQEWQMPPDGLGVAITIEAGELYVVVCSSTVEQLAFTAPFIEFEPSKPYILEGGYEAVLISGIQTIVIHPGSMYLTYAPLDVVYHQRHFYSLPTIQKSQLALTHSFVQGKRLSMDIGTLDVSRKLLCRMMVFWHDRLVLGKRNANDLSKLHVPTFESFQSTVEFFSIVSLCILINAYDPRSFQWLNKALNVNCLSQDDRIRYAFTRGIARRVGNWFFRNYEFVETKTGTVIDGVASFWIPALAIQASGLYRYKLAADEKLPVFATSCNVTDLKEELASCLELFPNAKETFDLFVAKPLLCKQLSLVWNVRNVYTVRKKEIPLLADPTFQLPPLNEDQITLFTTKRFLMKGLSTIDTQEAQEAATILVTLKPANVQVAADIVKKMKRETRWPSAAIANMILCLLQNLLHDGRTGAVHDPRTERIFANERDLEAYIDNVMGTCTKTVASKVELVLKSFCTSKDAPTISQQDLKTASELIAFLDHKDIDTITSVISSLGDFRMPVNGIANAVVKSLETVGPAFFREIADTMARRVARSIPSPFPTKALAKRERSASRLIQDTPEPQDSGNAPSTSKNAEETMLTQDAQEVQGPENSASAAKKAGESATRPASSPESSISAFVHSRTASPLPIPRSASAIRLSRPLASPLASVSANPTAYSAMSSVIGRGPERFKWWNIRLPKPIASPDELHLLEVPQPGDLLSYHVSSSNTAAMFQREELAWVNVTRNFFLNNGKTKHPLFPNDDPRFLTWKSKSNKTPTYVVKSTFDTKKFGPSCGGRVDGVDLPDDFSFEIEEFNESVSSFPLLLSVPCTTYIVTLRFLMQATADGTVNFESLLHRKGATAAFWEYLSLYESVSGHHTARPELEMADPGEKVKVTRLPIDQACMPHSVPAFIGTKARSERVPSFEELLQEGYQLIEYDGNNHVCVDVQDRVVLAVIPMPDELVQAGLNHALVTDMSNAQANIEFSASNATDIDDCNRGDFRTISTGISHGGGQKEPRNLNHTAQNSSAVSKLLRSSAVRSIARWQSECYETWMPKLFAANKQLLANLLQWKPTLSPNFASSVFGSTTFNFGPSVVCDFHMDHLNWATGMCAITSGGTFNYKKGGHLVLKQYRLIVEFPPCVTILLPSAIVSHGNLPISPGEYRISPAGGLQHVDNEQPSTEEDATAREERWVQLIRVQLAVYQELPVTSLDNPLRFVNHPKDNGDYQFDYTEENGRAGILPRPNTGTHSLETRHQANRPYVNQENALWEMFRMLQTFHQTEAVSELCLDVYDTLAGMEREKAMQWNTARGTRDDRPVFSTEIFFKRRDARSKAIDAACILSLILQYHYTLPRRGCELYLSGVKDIASHFLDSEHEIRVPKDPRPLTFHFNLDPITTTYISCPDCHCLYPYNPVQRLDNPIHCSYKKTPASDPCAAALWKQISMGPVGNVKKPIRKIYRDSASEADQQAVFEACGWRWSALLELEYWNPYLFTVIDSMHSLDLNLLQNHVRVLFRVDVKSDGGVALRTPTSARVKRVIDDKTDLRALRACQELIFDNPPHLLYELLRYQRKVLFSFCIDYDIRFPGHQTVVGTRWILAKNIHLWRQNPGSPMVQTFLTRYPKLSICQEELLHCTDKAPAQEDDADHREPEPAEDREAPDSSLNSHQLPKPTTLRRLAKNLLDLTVNGDEGKDALYARITAATIAHFCDVAQLDRSHIGRGTSPLSSFKRPLFDFLLQKLREDRATQELLSQHFSEEKDAPAARTSGAFLGKDVMTTVWADMNRTQLPSWITPVPRDWGTVRRGKLSADNWRIICCIHLPITLIRLFGSSEGRPRALLDNFMHLISAVRIATMRRSSPAQIEAYDLHMSAYSRGTLELFPEYSVLPSHHAALHIGDMLKRFGPKHSHDSPYYERYILFFHRLNTNNKIGEIEGTYLRTAVRSANILALLDDSANDRLLVEEMLARLQKHEKEYLRGFRLAESLNPFNNREGIDEGLDILGQTAGQLNQSDFDLLEVKFLEAISYDGNTYAIWNSRRYRDSAVLYNHGNGGEKAGVIQSIFLHRHRLSTGESQTNRYLSVLEYAPTQTDEHYRRLIRLESISCHVAITTFNEEDMVHVLPISRNLLSFELEPFGGAEADPDVA
ncbi:hypothetical protein H1R20_g4968, partial [Candolleomyces eurysporus]